MTGLLGQITFVIWRESMEVLLVVGILHAWLVHHAGAKAAATGRRYLWGGVAAGMAAAGLLAVIILSFASLLEGDREDYFQTAMAGFAALLIVQMVLWMHRQGRGLKQDLERGAERALTGGQRNSRFPLRRIGSRQRDEPARKHCGGRGGICLCRRPLLVASGSLQALPLVRILPHHRSPSAGAGRLAPDDRP